ncbi:MAG: ribbon-helix-helix domain-containing protein [bacterium]
MQITVRMPDEYEEKLRSLAKKMGLKRSDIVRMAIQSFLEEYCESDYRTPYQRAGHLLGLVSSGKKDLGQRHRHYLIEKLRSGSR